MNSDKQFLLDSHRELFRVEGFDLESVIAVSSQSVLLKALQIKLQRVVAIKFVPGEQGESARKRLETEAKILCSFRHPNIVEFYGMGLLSSGEIYVCMEFLSGQTLETFLQNKIELSEKQIRTLAIQICDALSYAHERNIVHRDLKPANLIMSGFSESEIAGVKLLDFGLLKDLTGKVQSQTQTNAIVGTANYMSPEQCRNESLDGRSDIYSLACILYELCCGQAPMAAESDWLVLSNHLDKNIDSIPGKLISRNFKKIILQCLQKDRSKRYASAADLKVALETYQNKNFSFRTLLIAAILLIVVLSTCVLMKRNSLGSQKSVLVRKVEDSSIEKMRLRRMSWADLKNHIRNEDMDGNQQASIKKDWIEQHLRDLKRIDGDLCDALIETRLANLNTESIDQLSKLLKKDASVRNGDFKCDDNILLIKKTLLLALIQNAKHEWVDSQNTVRKIFNNKELLEIQYPRLVCGQLALIYVNQVLQLKRYDEASAFTKLVLPNLNEEQKFGIDVRMADGAMSANRLSESELFTKNAAELLMNSSTRPSEQFYNAFCKSLFLIDPEYLRRAMQKYPPENFEQRHTLLKALMAKEHYSEADSLLSASMIAEAPDEEFRLKLEALKADCMIELRDPKRAETYLLPFVMMLAKAPQRDFRCYPLNDAVSKACVKNPKLLKKCDELLGIKQPFFVALEHIHVADSLNMSRRYDEALEQYNIALKYFDRDGVFEQGRLNVVASIAEIYMNRGDFSKAQATVDEGRKYEGSQTLTYNKFRVQMIQAKLYLAQQNYLKALQVYSDVKDGIGDQQKEFEGDYKTAQSNILSIQQKMKSQSLEHKSN